MPEQIVEIRDLQTFLGEGMENVYRFVDTSGVADIPTLLSTYVTDVLPLVKILQDDSLEHTELQWRTVYPAASLMLSYNTGLPVAGVDPGDPMATCIAASVKWILGGPTIHLTGGFTGHIKRGGTRLAGLDEGNVDGQMCIAAYQTALHTWIDELLLPGTGPWQLCVCSFLIGNPVPHVTRARSHTVTDYTIVTAGSDAAVSTQNTRKFLRGRSF